MICTFHSFLLAWNLQLSINHLFSFPADFQDVSWARPFFFLFLTAWAEGECPDVIQFWNNLWSTINIRGLFLCISLRWNKVSITMPILFIGIILGHSSCIRLNLRLQTNGSFPADFQDTTSVILSSTPRFRKTLRFWACMLFLPSFFYAS